MLWVLGPECLMLPGVQFSCPEIVSCNSQLSLKLVGLNTFVNMSASVLEREL
jgi:hypothetical protein